MESWRVGVTSLREHSVSSYLSHLSQHICLVCRCTGDHQGLFEAAYSHGWVVLLHMQRSQTVVASKHRGWVPEFPGTDGVKLVS